MAGFSIQRYRYKAIPNPPIPVCHKPTNVTTVKISQELCPKILLIDMFENRLDNENTVKISRDIRRTTWNDIEKVKISMMIFLLGRKMKTLINEY
jgi:hypothetical protein